MCRRKILLSAGSVLILISSGARAAADDAVAAEWSAHQQSRIQTSISTNTSQEGPLRQPVTLDLVDMPLGSALEAIARQAGLTLAYPADILPVGKTVTLNADGAAAADVLARILDGTGLEPMSTPTGQVVLARRPAFSPSTEPEEAKADELRRAVLTGRVTDAETGQPLRGANVRVDGTRHRTATNAEGRYRFEDLPPGAYTVVASMIGYGEKREPLTVTTEATATLDVVLAVSAVPLDEVVVTGTMVPTQMRAVPSPVSVITAEDIERKGVVRLEDILRSIPGVGVVTNSGQDHFSFLYVRGSNAFVQGKSTIKTYVDGVEVANPVYSLNQIDPSSIERIELLRGPQASTLHGSEAIAGVLQIFTKKGQLGVQRPRIQAKLAGGGLQSQYKDGFTPVQNHSASITGGDQSLSYRLGASYDYTGEWVEDELIDELGWTMRNSVIRDVGISGGVRYVAGSLVAEASARAHTKSRGDPLSRAVGEPARSGELNYPHYTKPSGVENELDLQTYSVDLSYAATSRWQHRFTIGQDWTVTEFRRPEPRRTTPADTFLTYSSFSWERRSIAYHTAAQLALGGSVSSTLQGGFDRSTFRERIATTQDAKQLTGGLGNQSANLTRGELRNHGFFVQAQAALRDQLFLTTGLRADKSTGFGDDRGYAWSSRAGLAHVLDAGRLMLKSRASYGSAIRPPEAQQRLGQTLGNFVTLPNDKLGPDAQSGYDLGLDLYIGPRFSISGTRYDQRAQDLIAVVRLSDPSAIPQTQQYQNVGRIRNTGWEFEASASLARLTVTGHYGLAESTVEQLSPTYTGSDFIVGQRPLDAPRRAGAFSVTYATERASAMLGMSYKGSWEAYHFVPYFKALLGTDPDREPYTGNLSDYIGEYEDIHRYEANATYRLTQQITVLLMIDNLLNDTKPDRWDIDLVRGRQVVVGVRLDSGP